MIQIKIEHFNYIGVVTQYSKHAYFIGHVAQTFGHIME